MLVLGGNGSVLGSTGWYLVTLGQCEALLTGTWLYCSVVGGTGCYLVVLGQYRVVLVGTW